MQGFRLISLRRGSEGCLFALFRVATQGFGTISLRRGSEGCILDWPLHLVLLNEVVPASYTSLRGVANATTWQSPKIDIHKDGCVFSNALIVNALS